MDYNPNQDKGDMAFEPPPVGMCRIRVTEAKETQAKSGADMVAITVVVEKGQEGEGYYMYDYIVAGEFFDTKIGQIYRALGIAERPGQINLREFQGKVAMVKIKHEEYPQGSGTMRGKIAYWKAREGVANSEPQPEPNPGPHEEGGDSGVPF